MLLLHVHLPPPLQGHLHVVLLVKDGFNAVGPKQLSQELDTYMQLVRVGWCFCMGGGGSVIRDGCWIIVSNLHLKQLLQERDTYMQLVREGGVC